MRPEKKEKIDPKEKYTEKGIPGEWIEPLQKIGYTTVEKLKAIEKPGKLANELNGFRKKNRPDLPGLSPETVAGWLKQL